MEKEIYQTPEILKNIYNYYKGYKNINIPKDFLKDIGRVKFIGCGTAYNSALFGAKYLEKALQKECSAHIASEFSSEFLTENTLCIFVSQSGETADTLACVETAKRLKLKTIAITNVMHSTLAQETDFVMPILAGTEIAVASTKAYCAQILVMLVMANYFAQNKTFLKELKAFVSKLKIPEREVVQKIIEHIKTYNQCFILGKGFDFYTATESALKIKEITYINCTALPSGELKHGTLALIDEGTPILMFCTEQNLQSRALSAKKEVEARGGKVLLLSQFDLQSAVKLQAFSPEFMPIAAILPVQLCAYKLSIDKGINPDKPRNLAKSVTVE